MFRSKNVKIFLVIAGVLAAAGGYYAYSEYNRRNPAMADLKADHQLNIGQALQAFESDANKANQQYLEKVLEIGGPIKAVEQDEKGFYTIVLGTEASMSSVRCVIDSVYSSQVAAFKAGSTARFRGICVKYNADDMGIGSDLILNRCCPVE